MEETYYIVRTYKRNGLILSEQKSYVLENAQKLYNYIEVDDYITRKEIDLITNDGTPDEIIESEEYEDDEEDIDDDDM